MGHQCLLGGYGNCAVCTSEIDDRRNELRRLPELVNAIKARIKETSMLTHLQPLGDRVLIRRTVNPAPITPGGLIIPEAARETPQEGTVIAKGDKVYELNIDDRVLFGRFAGAVNKVTLDDTEHLIMRETDVLGVIEMERR